MKNVLFRNEHGMKIVVSMYAGTLNESNNVY